MFNSRPTLVTVLCAALSLPFVVTAQTPAPSKTSATTKASTPTAADIAGAKAKGLVWCNNNTKVYHLSDSKYYGATKNGKFMTVADAEKAGFKKAQDNPAGKKKAASTTTTPSTKKN